MGPRWGRPAMTSIGDLRSEGIPPPRPSRRGFEGHPRTSQTIGVPQNCQHRLERSGLQLGYALLKALEKTPFRSTTTWFIIPPSLLPVRNPNSTIRPTMARRTSNDPQAIANVLRLIPAKWLVGMLVALVLYFFLQPKLNAWFGWNLPSIAAMAGNETPAKPASTKPTSTKPTSPKPAEQKSAQQKSAQQKSAQAELASTKATEPRTTEPKAASTKPSGEPTKSPATAKAQDQDDWKYRILKPLGRDRYESPSGLIYAPGSEEGHRLSHIARHLEDQPDRPGSHGVFDGDMAAFLVAIDDAYKRARGHAKGTKSRLEDGMTVYEAPFDQTIGYLGGTEGARKKNPKLKKLRLVLRDRNLITAFPIQ